jgi:thiol-disulfide isomerase/thioredoxin
MKTILYLSILLVTLCINAVQGQKFKTFEKFNDLEKALVKENDTLYVINFWATWCAPCVKELPHFESYNNENSNKKIKVILVSLDFSKQIDSHFKPFLKKKNYKTEVVLLNDKDYNSWLPKVDDSWSGSIPATWLIYGKKRLFVERDFKSADDLKKHINSFINQ